MTSHATKNTLRQSLLRSAGLTDEDFAHMDAFGAEIDYVNQTLIADPLQLEVLRAHLVVESMLERMLRAVLHDGSLVTSGQRWTFWHKLQIARALDIVDTRCANLFRHLNDLRNDLAHKPERAISDQDSYDLFEQVGLQRLVRENVPNSDERMRRALFMACYLSAGIATSLERPLSEAKRRSTSKKFVEAILKVPSFAFAPRPGARPAPSGAAA